jgi:hypothetical protein
MIWEHAFERRHVRIWGQWIPNYLPQSTDAPTSRYVIRSSACNPPALSVNSETRGIALRFFRPIQFRHHLSLAEEIAPHGARHANAASFQYWLGDFSLVSDSLAFFNARVGDTMTIELANERAYHIHLSPKGIDLDFSVSESYQLLRLKRGSHHTDHVVTSSLWQTLRFRWHIVGHLRTSGASTAGREGIVRIKCEENRHDWNKVIPKTGAILCRLCGERLAWTLEV